MNRHIIQTAKKACRELRKKSTSSERLLWQAVRNRKVLGKKFYRQYPIMFKYMDKERFFIADFFCYESRLVIEIDGKKHDDQKDYDELRTHVINHLGIEVVRFKNDEIDNDLNRVLRRLHGLLSGRTHPKSLS
jgi:very-short-patch-repair endonuclease